MKVRFPRVPLPSLTIRTLIVLGSVSVLLAWTTLVGGWLIEKSRLSRIDQRVALDVKALDVAHELEMAILAEQREALLWEATGQKEHQEKSDQYLMTAVQMAADLHPYVNTQREQDLSVQICREMTTLREQRRSATLMPSQVEPKLTNLLSTVDRFKVENEDQMEQSLQAADRLDNVITGWAIGLSLGTAGLLSVGSVVFIRRMVRPVLMITNAADRFGQGNFSARAPVLHDDELGALARTLNNMAEDIANREKDRLQFVAMAAHDLKNPALAIEIAARMLRDARSSEKDRKSYLDAMGEEARRLRTIVRDLTDDIQVASGRFSVQKTPVDLRTLVQQLIRAQSITFSDHQIIVDVREQCTVLGDVSRLERVVMNLVSNAVKYSPHDTSVRVEVAREESFALLTVSDQGRGITPEDLKVIFQPFGRGRSADTFAEGTGMGLYVVKQIVEAHGGRIEVESELGHGATFRVRLPLAPPGPAIVPVSTPDASRRRSGTESIPDTSALRP